MAIEFKDKSTKVLQNKAIEGGLASATSWLTLPRGTTAELALLVRRVGAAAFDTDQNSLVIDDGTGFQPVGGGEQAVDVSYDNTDSGLSATDVQEAIDELAASPSGPVATKLLINIMESTNGSVVAPNVPFTFSRSGDQIVLQIGAFSGTLGSNAFALFYEFIPVQFRPARSLVIPYIVMADGVSGVGLIAFNSDGHIDWVSSSFGTWGPGVVASVPAMTISYLVSEPA